MRKLIFYFLLGVLIYSCGENKKTDHESAKAESKERKDSTEKKANADSILLNTPAFKLKIFTNMEQIPFCIALPLNEYTMDPERSDEKAKFVFTKNSKKENYIEVKSMFRSDESVSLEKYFENSTSEEETEAQGKIIKSKYIRSDKNCFIVRGYWSNFPEQEFVEIVFLRNDDVVTFYWSYDMATEHSLSHKIETAILSYGTECKE